jgi:hypothetical protein
MCRPWGTAAVFFPPIFIGARYADMIMRAPIFMLHGHDKDCLLSVISREQLHKIEQIWFSEHDVKRHFWHWTIVSRRFQEKIHVQHIIQQFMYHGARLWNSAPLGVKIAKSKFTAKKAIRESVKGFPLL